MPEAEDWDDAIDVLCVGVGLGSLAYAILCAAADLEVLVIESAYLDPQTREYLSLMTDDLDGGHADPNLALTPAQAVPPDYGKRRTLEPFVGEDLRRWSSVCLHSPFGLLCTEIPQLEPMRGPGGVITAGLLGDYRPEADEPGPALLRWLRERAAGLFAPAQDRLGGLILEEGRIAGAVLDTADGPRRIRAAAGLALAVGPEDVPWPAQPELAGVTAAVAVVGRPGGRFARVELVGTDGPP